MASNTYRDETALIGACLAGDSAAWDAFSRQYRRLIRTTAARIRRSYPGASTDTDDLESHLYQRLLEDDCRRLRAWQGRARFSTYLVQVTRNLVLDYYALRNQRPVPEAYQAHMERSCVPETEDEWMEARKEAFRRALTQLSPKQATIIRLRLEGRTLNEIAQITNRPPGTVAVENSRAMEKLRHLSDTILKQINDSD
jgi:RNA polymerase sigma factor (sigma-70 family)